ncbi:MAG: plasmid recombination protein [Castellaniella sp.]|nr:plasmid recombination protein [Castellaniella sp.]
MGYQFAHIEGYARKGSQQRRNGRMQPRKWSVRDIIAEAERELDACRHVENPQPPVLLHGVMPSQAEVMAHAWAETAADAKGRRLRTDGLCLLAGIVSLPNEMADDWPQFRAATVHWLREQYGKRLRSVVEHTDEEHPHLHFYTVPLEGERFEALHVGRQAAASAAAAGEKKGVQNAAYKAAMQAWQDDFQERVAASFGLARTGPKRERLTRAQWKARKAQLLSGATARQIAGPVITSGLVRKQVTKKGGLLDIGTEYESGDELAARLDAAAREAYAPALKMATQVSSARTRADSMQAEAERHSREAEILRERLLAAENQLAQARKDVALYEQTFMEGLDGLEQESVVNRARDLRRAKAAKAQADYDASLSPEYREHLARQEVEFQRSLRDVEAEENRMDDGASEPGGPGAK